MTENSKHLSYDLDKLLKIVKEYGFELKPDSVIMDFGCGKGKYVKELNDRGYNAYGCDVQEYSDENLSRDIIRKIGFDPYILPFEDNTFDFIFSLTVFEHVQNYSVAIAELARVLKPGGFCLHIFPSRYNPQESHVYVPLSTIIQSYWWLYLWAVLGVRNEFQATKTIKETAEMNYKYLKDNTNYLSKRVLQKHFREQFDVVIFCEKEFLRYSQRGKYLYSLLKVAPFIPSLYSTFRGRVVLTKSPKKPVQ